MKKPWGLTRCIILVFSFLTILPVCSSWGKEIPKIAVWDLEPRNTPVTHARELTSFLVSEITKIKKYEVYSQENVRTLAGWTEERMKLGCSSSQCLTALGQMDIAKLISGSVGKIGNRYTVSLSLFDTQNARAENAISEVCQTEDELIELIQTTVRKLLGDAADFGASAKVEKPSLKIEKPASPVKSTSSELKDPTTGMEFVFVKGGCFEMGDSFGDGNEDEKPVHEVCVDNFYLGKYEVTQGQWEKVMGNNPSKYKGKDNPVELVTWNDAQQFIERLNNQSGQKYRLPTEAEWEYGARSGGKKEKYAGTSQEADLNQYAWYGSSSGWLTHLMLVGQKRPNGLGLYDMSGNVWEWCADRYDAGYYKRSPKDNPKGADSGGERVLRGGSWINGPGRLRAAHRYKSDPADRYSIFNGYWGFRLGFSPQ